MGLLDSLSKIASPIAAVVDGIAGLGSSFVNAQSQRETNEANAEINRENNAFNAEQAVLNRQFQSSEAKHSRNWSTSERLAEQAWQEEMIRQQNEYNSPANQLRMAMEAGINPASFDGSISPSSSPSGSPSSPSASSPYGSAASAASPIPMQAPKYDFDPYVMAQIANLNASTNKIEAETDEQKTRNKYIDALMQGQCDINNTIVHLNLAKEGLTRREADKVLPEIQLITSSLAKTNQECDNLRVALQGLEQDNVAKAFENEHAVELLSKKLEQIDSEIRVNCANVSLLGSQSESYQALAKYYLQEYCNSVLQGGKLALDFKWQPLKNYYEVKLQRIEGERARFDLDYERGHRETVELVKAGSEALGALGGTVTSAVLTYGVLKGVKGGAKVKVPTFSGTGIPDVSPKSFQYIP